MSTLREIISEHDKEFRSRHNRFMSCGGFKNVHVGPSYSDIWGRTRRVIIELDRVHRVSRAIKNGEIK